MRATLALLCLAALSVAAPVPKDFVKKKTDAEQFVGAWEIVESTRGGVPTGIKTRWTFDAELKMHSATVGSPANTHQWVVKLDPAKTPKRIDIDGYHGIYEFDGADIRVAYAVSGDRPADFKPAPGINFNLLRRVDAK